MAKKPKKDPRLGWQTMDKAPLDGSRVQLRVFSRSLLKSSCYDNCRYVDGRWLCDDYDIFTDGDSIVTYWKRDKNF